MCNRQGTFARTAEESWEYQNRETMADITTATAIAVRLVGASDAEGFPQEAAWENAPPIRFDHDWQGKNSDPQRGTEVRLVWSLEALYLKFEARYKTITVFPDAEANGWRDHLWERDVCEVFLQPNPAEPRRYKEFEIAPNGFWIDLDIAPGEKHDLRSGLRHRVKLDEQNRTWRAELALPMKSLTARFDPSAVWKVNFYRVEGAAEPRFYAAWRPTGTPKPNFHVPEAFGGLIFTAPGAKIRR
jgi:alpha-galactosidase